MLETLVTFKVSLVLRPQIMDTKERILLKAHQLFYSFGIRSVSMDDLAAQLGMSKKTLYQYYTDKEELVDAVFTAVMDENRKQCIQCKQVKSNAVHEVFLSFDMVSELLKTINPNVLFDLQKYHVKVFKKFQDFKDEFLYEVIKENLNKGIEEGLYRAEIDTDILTRYRLYSILLSFDTAVFPANKTNLIYIEEQLVQHFLYGIATPKGQKLIQKYNDQRIKTNQ